MRTSLFLTFALRISLPLAVLPLLGSCGSPPKPPAVDPSARRPANTAMAVDLQVCRNELANTRLLATESDRLAEATAATLERLSARPFPNAAASALPSPPPTPANTIYTVHFDFASAHAVVPADDAAALLAQARTAPLIVLRGRTDGGSDTLAESRIARERAATVRDYLVSAGIDPARIRATYQPVGDPVADNRDPTGRALNRRVEIEVYSALPIAMTSASPARP